MVYELVRHSISQDVYESLRSRIFHSLRDHALDRRCVPSPRACPRGLCVALLPLGHLQDHGGRGAKDNDKEVKQRIVEHSSTSCSTSSIHDYVVHSFFVKPTDASTYTEITFLIS